MDKDTWQREYGRLVTAYGKARNSEQMGVYFAALSRYPMTAVVEAVTAAIRESRGWPSAAELAERAHAYLAGHQAPAAMCDVCHGDKFTFSVCEGYHTPDTSQPPVPVNERAVCRRDFPHAKHEDAHFCRQCHPAARTA